MNDESRMTILEASEKLRQALIGWKVRDEPVELVVAEIVTLTGLMILDGIV